MYQALVALMVPCMFALAVTAGTLSDDATKALSSDRCTAILVGKKASLNGGPMTTHNSDCGTCDWRVNVVPAKDWPPGSQRPIYMIKDAYPRQVREDRGKTWSKDNLEDLPQRADWERMTGDILGYIGQVPHTYQLIEGGYGIMNEFQVAIGESTCAAKFYASPVTRGGFALFEVGELSQVALERTKTAREAILMMGALAEQFGYYSAAGWDNLNGPYGDAIALGEGGEALTVTDPDEAWMFHILPDDTGRSAIWAAQRIPDNHVSVVANTFVLQEIVPDSPDFLYSSNMWSIAKKMGWWDESQGLLNFKKTFAPERHHPSYSNRRVWRILSLANPGLNLPSDTNAWADDYPMSVPLDRPEGLLSEQDVMKMKMDHFEGTPYSLTEGFGAGPYGDPNRFDIGVNGDVTIRDAMEGEFPRAISLFRTSYSFVSVSRKHVPRELAYIWFSQYAPDVATYTPIYVMADAAPTPFSRGSMHKYNPSSAWWNFCVVSNYAGRIYNVAMVAVRQLQQELSAYLAAEVVTVERKLMDLMHRTSDEQERRKLVSEKLTDFVERSGVTVSNRWRDFFPELLSTYRDGYIVGRDTPTITIKRFFYPRWWLEQAGYFNFKGNTNGILFSSKDTVLETIESDSADSAGTSNTLFALLFIASNLVVAAVGYVLGWKRRAAAAATDAPINGTVHTRTASDATGDNDSLLSSDGVVMHRQNYYQSIRV